MARSAASRIRDVIRASGRYLDLIVATGMAFAVAIVSFLDVTSADGMINEAILMVLGLHALAVIRDRKVRHDAAQALSSLRSLDSSAIGHELNGEHEHSAHWSYRGSTGASLRTGVLPRLTAHSRRRGGSLDLQVELADPLDAELCAAYAREAAATGGPPLSTEDIRDDVLVTLVTLCYLVRRFPTLHVRAAVSRALTTFTVNLGDTKVVVEPLSESAQALVVDGKLSHFHGYRHDLAATYSFARQLPLASAAALLANPQTVDIEELNALLVELGTLPDTFDRADLAGLAENAGKALSALAPRAARSTVNR